MGSCNIFRNTTKDKTRDSYKDKTETSLKDKSVIELETEIDTTLRIAPNQSTLITSIEQLLLKPMQYVEQNGLGVRLQYDSASGSLKAEAFQKERLIPVKQKLKIRKANDIEATEERNIKAVHKDANTEHESTVDGDKVILVSVFIVCAFIFIYKFLNRKKQQS